MRHFIASLGLVQQRIERAGGRWTVSGVFLSWTPTFRSHFWPSSFQMSAGDKDIGDWWVCSCGRRRIPVISSDATRWTQLSPETSEAGEKSNTVSRHFLGVFEANVSLFFFFCLSLDFRGFRQLLILQKLHSNMIDVLRGSALFPLSLFFLRWGYRCLSQARCQQWHF